jgi:hypothetical protein
MIVPTYKPLPTNNALLSKMGRKFDSVEFKEFLSGGVIVIIARKSRHEIPCDP